MRVEVKCREQKTVIGNRLVTGGTADSREEKRKEGVAVRLFHGMRFGEVSSRARRPDGRGHCVGM